MIFGITGCGKSTLTAKVAGLFPRRVIFDRLRQWPNTSGLVATTYEQFRDLYRSLYTLAEFTIYFQPKAGMGGDALLQETDKILSLIYQVESVNKVGLALIFEEIWLYAPIHRIPTWFQEVILTGRNFNISVVGNAQRPATVCKSIVSQCSHIFVGQFFESRDRLYFESTFGRIPEIENPPAKFSFYWFETGKKPILVST